MASDVADSAGNLTPTAASGAKLALRIEPPRHTRISDSGDASYEQRQRMQWWFEYRPNVGGNGMAVAVPYCKNGANAYLFRYRTERGALIDHCMDTTPQSALGFKDASLVLGRSLYDPQLDLCVTTIARDPQEKWLDLHVEFGPFEGNRAPLAYIDGPATVAMNTPATFNVTATDPDGDALAYEWRFGIDAANPSNSPNIFWTWTKSGNYRVQCIVSDRKGKSTVVSHDIRVGTASMNRLTGTVTDAITPALDLHRRRGKFSLRWTRRRFLENPRWRWRLV
jgi:hypothetical protein